jgi:NTE family protein
VADDGRRRCDLVLGGGGVRGVAHIGALAALEEAGYEVMRAAGASAGAIAGAFAVAGLDAGRLAELFQELDLTRFTLSNVMGRLEDNRAMSRLVRRFTENDTDPLEWLTGVLDAQGVQTFADLRVDGIDDDAPIEQRYRLVVRCLDVVNRRIVRLPWDYEQYGLDPDAQPVARAVRASMSVPFVFDPVHIGAADTEASGLLIDGGLTSGFPVSVLDRPDGPPRWPTFGIRLLPRAPADAELPETTLTFARMVIDALLDSSDQLSASSDCDARRTVPVDLSDVRALDVDTAGQERDLFGDGYDAMRTFLEGFSFDDYVSACR